MRQSLVAEQYFSFFSAQINVSMEIIRFVELIFFFFKLFCKIVVTEGLFLSICVLS